MLSTISSAISDTICTLSTVIMPHTQSDSGLQLRESRLRKAGIAGRARMASELRDMDEDVSSLSRTLAVRTLQLEMEYIFSCIEDEALDIAQDLKGAGFLLLR